MKLRDFTIALILTLCVVLSFQAYKTTLDNIQTCQEIKNEIRGIFDALESMAEYNKNSRIVISEGHIFELANELAEMKIENQSLHDYISGYWDLWHKGKGEIDALD